MRMLPSRSSARIPFAILKCASWLVPNRQRAEWAAEWRAELWYVCERCTGQSAVQPRGVEDAVAFSLGAFQDAFWIRRNSFSFGEAEVVSIGVGAAVCGAFVGVGCSVPVGCSPAAGDSECDLWSPYRDAKSLVLISPDGYLEATSPTVSLEAYQEWKGRRQRLFEDFAFYRPILSKVRNRWARDGEFECCGSK